MPRLSSVRASLIRSFVGLIAASSLGVLLLAGHRARSAERQLSARLIDGGVAWTSTELDSFFLPTSTVARAARAWGRLGALTTAPLCDGEAETFSPAQREALLALDRLLLPVLEARAEIGSANVADVSGCSYLLLREGERFRHRVTSPTRWGGRGVWLELERRGAGELALGSPRWETLDYDARKRDWYKTASALEEGAVAWTKPYTFFTTREPGITAIARFERAGVMHVVAFDVLLSDLSRFTTSLHPTPRSLVLVAGEGNTVVGLPTREPAAQGSATSKGELAPMASLGIAPITAAAELPTGAAPREVSAGGEDWWLGRQRYEREGFPSFDVVVVVPSADLLGDLRRLQAIVLGAALVTIAAALGFAFLVARRLSAPLEVLAGESRRLRDLDFGGSSSIDTPLRELRELAEAHEQSRKALESFARYVPLEVVRELVAKGEVAQIGGKSEVLTILFTDIAGFTSLSESMEPRALTEHMAEYFGAMIAALHEHGATVDKMVGDAIVAFWGAPERRDDHARRAALGVLACVRALERLTPKWREEGKPELPTRFGLATGSVVVGNVGAPTRLAYTVLGDVANLASRLEGANKEYGTTVIAALSTIEAAGPGLVTRRLDALAVKGKEAALEVCELVGLEGEVPASRLAELRAYEQALDAYRARRFDEAARLLEPLAATDPPSKRLLAEVRAASALPVDAPWSPITRLTTK